MFRVTTASLSYSSYITMLDIQGFMASALLYADDALLLVPLLVIFLAPPSPSIDVFGLVYEC